MKAISRREVLELTAIALGSLATSSGIHAAPAKSPRKKVAAVVTVYFPRSHADVILGKILDGWEQTGGPGPALELVAVYVDQFPRDDLARETCAKHNVPIVPTIREALTLGGKELAVDGVLSIGEHGDYPLNEIGQQMYPRRRFWEEITQTFADCGRSVPVFNDKHLGPVWQDARWMYDRSKELKFPMMAGSSMPVGYRLPDPELPWNCDVEAAVGIGYDGLEIYGFHALEFYQTIVERRRGAERGVRNVRCLTGSAVWEALDNGTVSKAAFDAAYAATPKEGNPDPRQDPKAALFLFEYLDGLTGAVFMLNTVVGTSTALKLRDNPVPIVTAFDERTTPRHPHFAYLLKAFERMVYTGQPAYPVERTLLTSGILDRALHSHAMKGKLIETPELAIAYQPVDYPHAPHPDLMVDPRG